MKWQTWLFIFVIVLCLGRSLSVTEGLFLILDDL